MHNKVLLKTADGSQVRPEGFTILDFPDTTNRRGFRSYPDVLFLGERAFVFDNACKLPDGGNGAEYVEAFAYSIVPIAGVDDNGFTAAKPTKREKSREEMG